MGNINYIHVTILWRCKSQWKFLPRLDTEWTYYYAMSPDKAVEFLRNNQNDSVFEYKIYEPNKLGLTCSQL